MSIFHHVTYALSFQFATQAGRSVLPPIFLLALLLIGLGVALATADERVVVLRNGNSFAGDVTETERRVIVRRGSTQVAFDPHEVDLIADNLQDSYRQQAARIPQGNVAAREKLMSWCIQNHLPHCAAAQLELLRKEHPTLPHFELWQRRIASHARLGGKNILPPKAPEHPDVRVALDAKSKLSESAQAGFVRRIQPILWNRCAQATCHGRLTKTDFPLVRGRSRNTTQRNLGATLRQLHADTPQQSLLWLSANEFHGGAKKRAITEHELVQLLDWMLTVNRDLGVLSAWKSDRSRPATASDLRATDPFDPEEFNQSVDSS